MHPLSQEKFRKLSEKQQHKLLAGYLRERSSDYDRLSENPIGVKTASFDALTARYHHHLALAGIMLSESALLYEIREGDRPSDTPYLPIYIYLDSLRSAHNVGSILRTVEAFRLGTVCFSEKTPDSTHPTVIQTAMGCAPLVPILKNPALSSLPRPFIALETAPDAPSTTTFPFPERFTLLLGNEERGLSKELLAQADICVQIPLFGSKNSLNVANALAIAASHIRQPSK